MCVIMCDLKTSTERQSRPELGYCTTGKSLPGGPRYCRHYNDLLWPERLRV